MVAVISTDPIARHIVTIVDITECRPRIIIERAMAVMIIGTRRIVPEIVPAMMAPIVITIVVTTIIVIEVTMVAIVPVMPIVAITMVATILAIVATMIARFAIALCIATII